MVAFHADAANIGKPALSAPKIVDFLFITSLCVVKKRENTSTKLQNAGEVNYRKLFVYMAGAAKKRQNAGGDNYRKLFVYMTGAAKKRQSTGEVNYRKLFVYMTGAAKKRQSTGEVNYRKLFVYMAGAATKRQNTGGNNYRKLFVYMAGAAKKRQNAGGDNYRKLFVYMTGAAKKRQSTGEVNYRKLFVYMAGAAKKRQNAGGNRFLPSRTRPDERGVCFRRNGHICLPRCPYILTVVAIYTHHGSHIYSPTLTIYVYLDAETYPQNQRNNCRITGTFRRSYDQR
ncbi:hypothetical protein M1B74_04725 [Bacteroides pyogenes]|uniref:hypothetical protein n=1 Tax=Bacteroides pyogenes TaxID=310300 RepID=UPI003B42E1A1